VRVFLGGGGIVVGPNLVELLGEEYTGSLHIRVNGQSYALPRDNVGLLVEQLSDFIDQTALCPRCQHSRLDHFRLWTNAGTLQGCSHGTGEGWKLADGLPCDCPGTSS
jgi:hypothetical protein